jgi:hypothetical protein
MELNWKTVESLIEPQAIDESSSPGGVYIHKSIQSEKTTDNNGNEQTKWTYSEAYLTNEEYSMYQLEKNITNSILQQDDSEAYENYKTKLDTAIEYTNSHFYKPKWAEDTYAGLLQKGALLPSLFPLKIWDATELEENAVSMTMAELTALTVFLAQAQETYFEEYKREKTS